LGTYVEAANSETGYLEETMRFVREKYVEDINERDLMQSTLQGIFNGLDKYTTFFTVDEAEAYLADIEGVYAGIGTVLLNYGDFIVVYDVLPNSPAERGGLMRGDRITAVDGMSCVGIGLDTAIDMIKGPAGTKVFLEIIRENQKYGVDVEINREVIKINPIEHNIIDGVGYIKITIFNDNVDEYFRSALQVMNKANIKKLILDLRDNPGGEAGEAVAVAEHLVPKGLITKLDFKSEQTEDLSFYSKLEEQNFELVVLVNSLTASASEILAGAIQDTEAGTLIGTRTYGKSKVQNIFPMLTPEAYEKYKNKFGITTVNAFDLIDSYEEEISYDDIIGWVKITTGEYFTPLGRRIDRLGLVPDIAIEDYSLVNGIDIHDIDKLRNKVILELQSEDIDVINAEKILSILGYKVEKPDMCLDSNTAKIIKEYQQKKGIGLTSKLDKYTQVALNQDLERLILEIDKQLGKAVELLN
jgi:carboxyl-terminal processing protease